MRGAAGKWGLGTGGLPASAGSVSLLMCFDLRFHAKAHRLEAEAHPGRADAENTTRLVALAKEQLALIADDWFHGISFRLGD